MQMDAGVIMSRMSCRTRFVSISHLLMGTFMVKLSGNSLLQRFRRDQSGTYMIVAALAMPVLVGTAGLGTEAGWWLYTHKNMQSAADSAAVSAATQEVT
jgi:Flp pilus assembly protein TadG